MKSIDIFCRVLDNYGDIGVCWRLAKELSLLPQARCVRLWVDNMQTFARIEPAVQAQADRQQVAKVQIIDWTTPAPDLVPHDIVIEAFACSPPAAFIERMKRQPHLWINLEYLSAESWIEGCHALPSRQANGMTKTFFFPGFTKATGGLLREAGLLAKRDHWLADTNQRWLLLKEIGLPEAPMQRLRQDALQVMLFCYPHAPAQALIDSLGRQPRPSVVIVPEGVYPALRGQSTDHAYIHEMPFVDQARFDRLLWSSDLNLVRGEDSLVRALWAAKPMIWQIYPQAQQAHMEKLQAWLSRSPYSPHIHPLIRAWNTGDAQVFDFHLHPLLAPQALARWCNESRQWTTLLAEQPDLAQALLAFCTTHWETS